MKLKPTFEQTQIINHERGHAMVQAGPGCAKTSTLALRTQYLIRNGCDPKGIVFVTYTKALASDIKNTLNKQLGEKVAGQVVVKTLHSFAFLLMREHSKQQNATLPTVLKRKRKRQLIARYAKEYELKKSEINQAFHHLALGEYSKLEKHLGKDKAKSAKSAFKAYSKLKQKHNKLDFEDMICQALNLLLIRPLKTAHLCSISYRLSAEVCTNAVRSALNRFEI